MVMGEDLKKLYDAISPKFDIGDFDTFSQKMQTPEQRKSFYDVVSSKGLDLGDYNEYEDRLKKKEFTQESLVDAFASGKGYLETLGIGSTTPPSTLQPQPPTQEQNKPVERIPKEAVNRADSYSPLDYLSASKTKQDFIEQDKNDMASALSEEIKGEVAKIEAEYAEQAKTFPRFQLPLLEKQKQERIDAIIEGKASNLEKGIQQKYFKDTYETVAPEDVKIVEKEIDGITQSGKSYETQKRQIDELKALILQNVPQEKREAAEKELNYLIAKKTAFTSDGNMSLFGWKSEAQRQSQLLNESITAAQNELKEKYPTGRLIVNPTTGMNEFIVEGLSAAEQIKAQQDYDEVTKAWNIARLAKRSFDDIMNIPMGRGNFMEGISSTFDQNLLSLGWSNVYDEKEQNRISKAISEGTASPTEKLVYNLLSIKDIAENSETLSKWYNRGKGIGESLPHMLAFAAGSGPASLGSKTAIKIAGEGAKGAFKRNVVGGIGSSIARVPTLPGGYADAISRMTGAPTLNEDLTWSVDESSIEPTWKAILKGGWTNFSEALGESSGGFGQGTVAFKKAGAALGIAKIPKGTLNTLKTIGMNPLFEFPEELFTNAIQAPVVDGKEGWKEVWKAENVWETFVQTALMGGFFGGMAAPSVVGENIRRGKTKETLDIFGKDIASTLRTSIENNDQKAFNAAYGQALDYVEVGSASMKDLEGLVKYAYNVAVEKGATVAQNTIPEVIAETTGAPIEELRGQPDKAGEEVRVGAETKPLTDNLARTQEIEQLAKNEGYEFEVEADSDSNMTSLNVLDGEKRKIEPEDLPEGIRTLAAEYTQLMHQDEVAIEQNDVVELLSSPSDTKVSPKGESAAEVMPESPEGVSFIGQMTDENDKPVLDTWNVEIDGNVYTFNTPIGSTQEEVAAKRDAKIAEIKAAPSDINETIKSIKPPFIEINQENVAEIENNVLSSLQEKGATEAEVIEAKGNLDIIKKSVDEKARRQNDDLAEDGAGVRGEISEIRPEEVAGNEGSYLGIFRGRRDGNRTPRISEEEQPSKQLAPNGEKSNLSPENHAFVRTPEFKSKFGDWQKGEGSVVLDRNGEPLLVYSGKGRYHMNGIDPTLTQQKVLFFTGDKALATQYAQLGGKQPVVYRGFINIQEGDVDSGASRIDQFHDNQQEFVTTRKDQFVPVGAEEVPKLKKKAKVKGQEAKSLKGKRLLTTQKQAVQAPIISETTQTTTQGENVPPTKDGEAKTPIESEGKKEYRIGQRALKSDKLNQEVKDGLAEKGIDYVPRSVKMVEAEVKELVDLYIGEEGGLQALEGMVYNHDNGLNPDTRTYLSVFIAEEYDRQLREATDIKDINRIKDKYAELIYQGQKDAANYGRGVRAQRKWQDVLGTHPDFMIRAARKAKAAQVEEELFDKKEDVNLIYSTIKDFLKSPEFEKVIEEKVGEEIDKIASKRLTPEGKKKIDNFFNGLKVKTDNHLFDATIGIPIAAYNLSIDAIRKAVLLGVTTYDAIAAGVDAIDRWYKEKYEKGEVASPQWQKKEYIATMKEKLKPLLKKTSPSVSRKQPSESQTEKIVNKLYEKTSLLTKPQLRKLVKNSIEHWVELGALPQERFRNEVARAMGKPYLSTKQEIELFELAKSLSDVKNHGDKVDKAAKDLIEAEEAENPNNEDIQKKRDALEKAVNDARDSQFAAQKAAKRINEIFAEEMGLWDTWATLIKGNLLTTASLTVNAVANLTMPVLRGPKAVVASMLDTMLSGIAYAYKPLVKRVSAEKHPWVYKQLQKLPSTERSMYLGAYVRGASFEGAFRRGLKAGVRQLWTGQLPDDIMKREIPRGLDPIKAAMRLVDGMKGRETMTLEQYIAAFMEFLPAGYTGEMMFRLLNLGDKPFREAAYNGRLSEIARQKGITGDKRKAFMAAPDEDSHNDAMAEAYKAVWQNDNMVSKFISDISKSFDNKHKNNVILQSEVVKALAKMSVAVFAPYVKTPTNVVRETFEYAAPLYSMTRGIESAYKGNRREALNFFSKAIVGSAISWVALEMFLNGIVSPPAPDDDDKERQMMYAEERPSMINLSAYRRWLRGGSPKKQDGDVIVSYKRYGVLSSVLNSHIKAYTKVDPKELRDIGYFRKQWMVMPMVISSSLDESFLSGMSTGLTGLMEGGAAMDNMLLNTSRALSAGFYPNTSALVSKTFFDENYIREVKDLSDPEETLKRRMINDFKDRMFMGKQLPTKVSIWGERVERVPSTRLNITGAEWTRFAYMMFPVTQAEQVPGYTFGAHIWELYKDSKWTNEEDAAKILPSLPSSGTEVGWEKAKMTPQEYEQFQMEVGKRRAYYAEGYVGTEQWNLDDLETKAKTLSDYYTKARKEAMAEMFDWTAVKAQNPVSFKVVEELGLLPFPTKTRAYNDIVFTLEEVREYNEIAMSYYLEDIALVEAVYKMSPREENVKAADEAWGSAIKAAKAIVEYNRITNK